MTLSLQYAQWEEAQKDFRRARSVWERALDVNPQSITLWLRYAEMEMRGRFVNHARNVWDRAVQVYDLHGLGLLPNTRTTASSDPAGCDCTTHVRRCCLPHDGAYGMQRDTTVFA